MNANPNTPDELSDLGVEARFIRQEHRLIPALNNLIRHWGHGGPDPRRRAAIEALAWLALGPGAAVTFATGAVAVTSLWFAYQQTQLVDRQNLILEREARANVAQARIGRLEAAWDEVVETGDRVFQYSVQSRSDLRRNELTPNLSEPLRIPFAAYDSISKWRIQLQNSLHETRDELDGIARLAGTDIAALDDSLETIYPAIQGMYERARMLVPLNHQDVESAIAAEQALRAVIAELRSRIENNDRRLGRRVAELHFSMLALPTPTHTAGGVLRPVLEWLFGRASDEGGAPG